MKILLISFILALICYSNEAFSSSKGVLDHLGTRTPYRFKINKSDTKLRFPGCKVKKIWMIVRHGTRMPSSDDIVGVEMNFPQLKFDILLHNKLGKGKLSTGQVEKFRKWSTDMKTENEKILALEGRDEMVLLGERMQKRFPGIIKTKYDNETFLFKYTATERARQSARYFTNGIFGKYAKYVVFAPVTKVDLVLRFYKHCDRWQKQVKKNPETYMEQDKFGLSHEMNETLQHVSSTLGFNSTLSLEKVELMYKMCGFETAWNKHYPSPWCAAFDERTAEVLEYYMDLKHYWADGYGHELTYRQACMALKNMFDSFSSKRSATSTFYFTHSGTILKLLSHLGLYKPDSHLRADNFKENLHRTWKTTDIDCFASNIAFVLYQCEDGEHVLILHQERPIKMAMCKSELCPLEVLTNAFKKSIHNCDYTDMCSLNP